MTTLADVTYRVAEKITDVLQGNSTAGTDTSLTDTALLTQSAGHWQAGTVWILSGAHAGKFAKIATDSNGTITFPTLGTSPHPCRYAVARKRFPIEELIKKVNVSLEDERAWILDSDTTLLGDGVNYEYTIPAGVSHIKRVEIVDTWTPPRKRPSRHWQPIDDKIRFGYIIPKDYGIHLWYRKQHDYMSTATAALHPTINTTWLTWYTVMLMMEWALRTIGDSSANNFAIQLQEALDMLKDLQPRTDLDVEIQTA